MDITVELTGRSPLLQHNPQLADPLNPIVKEIGTYTKKRTKTDEDRAEVSRLEWFGGLYVVDGIIVVPLNQVRGCIIGTARASKQGRAVERSVYFKDQFVPLIYEGTSDIKALYDLPGFVDRASVVISGKRTFRVRPRFYPWHISARLVLNDNMLDVADFIRIITLAGTIEGIGDNRKNGYGRFDVEVKTMEHVTAK